MPVSPATISTALKMNSLISNGTIGASMLAAPSVVRDFALALHSISASSGLLLDAYAPQIAGGTGATFDWTQVPPDLGKPVILAGGLTPEHITRAIHAVRPYAVDVSSGVEQSKGIKDAAKIAAFIRNAQYS